MTALRADPADASVRVAALRYIVLRKLAPGLRHALMGHLQAVQWATEAAARGLQAGSDPAKAHESLNSARRESIAAIKSSDSMMQWLRPTAERGINARDGIAACVKLASEDWFLRGLEASVDLPDQDFEVAQRSLQEMIVVVLLALVDIHPSNADIQVHARAVGDTLEVALTATTADRQSGLPMPSEDRPLTWADVELLAETHCVDCACDASGAKLRFDRFAS